MRKIEPLLRLALTVFAMFLCGGTRVVTIYGEDTDENIQEDIQIDDENDAFEAEEYEEYVDELGKNNEEDEQSSEDVEATQDEEEDVNEKYLDE